MTVAKGMYIDIVNKFSDQPALFPTTNGQIAYVIDLYHETESMVDEISTHGELKHKRKNI